MPFLRGRQAAARKAAAVRSGTAVGERRMGNRAGNRADNGKQGSGYFYNYLIFNTSQKQRVLFAAF